MIDLVTTKEVQSRKIDGQALCDNSKNCWDTIRFRAEAKSSQQNEKQISQFWKTWKIKPKKTYQQKSLLIEEVWKACFVGPKCKEAWKACFIRPKCMEDK